MNVRVFFLLLVVFVIAFSCKGTKTAVVNTSVDEEAVVIANDSLEYEIIIIDQGFNSYLLSIAKPKWYYSEAYYKTKNNFYVTQWNIRVREPFKYSPNIYEQQIDYDANIEYGLEVNYMLFNYFKFVEYKYKVKFY